MAYKIYDFSDNILRFGFIGAIDQESVDAFYEELQGYLEQATPENQVKFLVDATKEGRMSAHGRKTFAEINKDHRVGRTAICGTRRAHRTVITFVLIVTNRKNIRFFEDAQEARVWLEAD